MPNWEKSLGLAAALLLIAGVAYYAIYGSKQADTNVRTSGIIEGPEVNLAPKAPGRISEI